MNGDRTSVTVEIAGEAYTIRTDADPDYARRCAAYIDDALTRMGGGGSPVEPHKAVLLAALGIADELFQAREESEALRRRLASLARKLTADVRAAVPADELAPPS